MGAHRHEHELAIEIVLPHEDLGLLFVCRQADIACNAIAGAEDITAVLTLEDDLSLAFVDDSETGLGTTVCGVGVVKQSVGGRDGGLACSQIDDADGLAERDVLTAVCQRLLDGEIVEFGIAAFQALVVEGKEGVARTLEGDELIAQGHLTTQLLILRAVKRVFVVGTVVVVVAHHAEVEFGGEW